MRTLSRYILKPLTIIGALNWGVMAVLGIDAVGLLFGPMTFVTRIIYIVIAMAALVLAFLWAFNSKPSCSR